MKIKQIIQLTALTFFTSSFFHAQAAPTPVAEYRFNNSFASAVLGAPAIVPVDPMGQSNFQTDSVFGRSQPVYSFNGDANPPANQAGLYLSTDGLLTTNNVYSVDLILKFNEAENHWRRIIDVQNRQSDTGFYVSPENRLQIYPVSNGSTPFTNNEYHEVLLTNDNGTVRYYLDGVLQNTSNTPLMDIDSNNRMNFFLDNVAGAAQTEYSDGSVALIRIYNEALTAPPLPIPEPETYAMMLAGLGLLGFIARRKDSTK